MKHFTIRHGAPAPNDPAPVQRITGTVAPTSVALMGEDFPGLRPKFLVTVGARVTQGQTLFTDRKEPRIAHVSPVSGVVTELSYGPRRTLSTCILSTSDDVSSAQTPVLPDTASHNAPRDTLLARGFWPAFRTRPFGRTPAADETPDAIVVNAVHAASQAPDPSVVLDDQRQAFALGIEWLTRLIEGKVHICQSPGDPLGPAGPQITHTSFIGTTAAGLTGTQVDRLCPVDQGGRVWTIGYQDVAAIGHLFATGLYTADRVVSITGPAAGKPMLVRCALGASIADFSAIQGNLALSGDRITGREALFLGRFDTQVTLLPRVARRPEKNWLSRHLFRQNALIPTRAVEHAMALDLLTVPLLRALSVGDSEAAANLGCLGLVEEDLAALSRTCTSGADYGELLRRVLDDLMAEAA